MGTRTIENAIYTGAAGRKALVDLNIPPEFNGKIIVFIHGFMGFKDWGCWSLMEAFFIKAGFGFCKFNMSHNGTTLQNPADFNDLQAFSTNRYSYERTDLGAVLDWIKQETGSHPNIHLIGHSRGGGIALLGGDHPMVEKIATLAAISDIEKRFPTGKAFESWKENGFYEVQNGRTKQSLPIRFSQFEDFEKNREELSIHLACGKLLKPTMIIHGTDDTVVLSSEAEDICRWLNTRPVMLKGANHTFGAAHPWHATEMPQPLSQACELIRQFFLT
jgi:pimeloyl-ACP methyl ester carboxylesterase